MDDLVFGLQVTILGMGIVFGLLAVLWILLTLVLRFERRAETRSAARENADAEAAAPQPVPPASAAGPAAEVAAAPAPDTAAAARGTVRLVGAPADLEPALVAAIGVVILRHAETRRRQAAPAMRSYWPGSLLFASRWVASGRTRQSRSWTRRAR